MEIENQVQNNQKSAVDTGAVRTIDDLYHSENSDQQPQLFQEDAGIKS